MFKLNNLKSPVGSNHAPLRKGKGIGSGLGKTAGKGHKGQLARSGGHANLGHGFEGGQVPLMRRAPKVGFNSPLRAHRVDINITELKDFAGRELLLKDLLPKSNRNNPRVKLSLIGTKAPKAFPKSIEAHHVSPAAKKVLEAAGVKVSIIDQKTGRLGVKKVKKVKK
jgi:large subunit ribosomal protein L15